MMRRGNSLDSVDDRHLVYTNKLMLSSKYVDFEALQICHELDKRRQNPLGHPPNELVVDQIGGKRSLHAAQYERDFAANPGLPETRQRRPKGSLDFIARDERGGTSAQRENEGTHDDGRQCRGPGIQIVQGAELFRAREVDA